MKYSNLAIWVITFYPQKQFSPSACYTQVIHFQFVVLSFYKMQI